MVILSGAKDLTVVLCETMGNCVKSKHDSHSLCIAIVIPHLMRNPQVRYGYLLEFMLSMTKYRNDIQFIFHFPSTPLRKHLELTFSVSMKWAGYVPLSLICHSAWMLSEVEARCGIQTLKMDSCWSLC